MSKQIKANIQAHWSRIEIAINQKNLRERILLLVTGIAGIVLIAQLALLSPLSKFTSINESAVAHKKQDIVTIHQNIHNAVVAHLNDSDAANLAKIQHLRQRLENDDSNLVALYDGMVSPKEMAKFIENIINKNAKIRITHLEKLPVEDISKLATDEIKTTNPGTSETQTTPVTDKTPTANIYKHGIELTFEGNYWDTVDFLASLETLPWKVLWGKVELALLDHPTSSTTLVVYTLSLDSRWMEV